MRRIGSPWEFSFDRVVGVNIFGARTAVRLLDSNTRANGRLVTHRAVASDTTCESRFARHLRHDHETRHFLTMRFAHRLAAILILVFCPFASVEGQTTDTFQIHHWSSEMAGGWVAAGGDIVIEYESAAITAGDYVQVTLTQQPADVGILPEPARMLCSEVVPTVNGKTYSFSTPPSASRGRDRFRMRMTRYDKPVKTEHGIVSSAEFTITRFGIAGSESHRFLADVVEASRDASDANSVETIEPKP